VGVDCPACDTELRVDAKFCDECGAPVWKASAAEYKQVTVLFADVVHSMDLAAAVGPERLRELMSELLDRSSAVVQRYGGTVNQFTGDGVMAIFGAPMSLEDHAIRACLAALEIHKQVRDLQLRIGLNSGEVIAGEIGSGMHRYTTIGDQVGMAQRMESAAPPGGVMLSQSTARLVGSHAVLSERLLVRIKGADDPVPAYELLSTTGRRSETAARASTLVGREWELTALNAMLDRAINGHGCVVGVVGPPGIGKSRIVAETTKLAAERGLPVYSTYCESHTSDVPFQAANRLLRSAWRVNGLDSDAARDVVRSRLPGAHPADLALLYDELGIRDPTDPLPDIAPEARRRRLTALVNASVVTRVEPVVYVIEDVHWMDSTSESLLTDFLTVIPRAPALVLTTYRPEYTGDLTRIPGAQTIALAPLDDSPMTGLVIELLGRDASVVELASRVAERASGNPFFAEEIVRDLEDRGVLSGERGAYTCAGEATDVDVPATVQAAIAARIDRLAPEAKLTLNAAAVIGLRFEDDLLAALVDRPAVASLLDAELIDQVTFTPTAEYAFRHPLIRSVAYKSQLAAARADLHRTLAAAIETRDPESAEVNAALVAEHLEAAGDLTAAFGWHMRAGNWLTFRDIRAARQSWQRAVQVADHMSADKPGREQMRIGPRVLLCANSFRSGSAFDDQAFEDVCRLSEAVDDKVSLAMALGGRIASYTFAGRYRESSSLATELIGLTESIGDANLELALLPGVSYTKLLCGDVTESLRLTQRVIELADGDPLKGANFVESPLSLALMVRAAARMLLGAHGWKGDQAEAAQMCWEFSQLGLAVVMAWKYLAGVTVGAVRPDATAVRETAEILEMAEQSGDDLSLASARSLHGFILAQQTGPDRDRGLALLALAREAVAQGRSLAAYLSSIDCEFATERALRGDVDGAIEALQSIVEAEIVSGGLGRIGGTTETLVEILLRRGGPADIEAAREAIDRAEAVPTQAVVIYDLPLLRLRALLARACGDEVEYRRHRDRYRALANEVGFDEHIAKAEAMA
jgi:adenylate cyclase